MEIVVSGLCFLVAMLWFVIICLDYRVKQLRRDVDDLKVAKLKHDTEETHRGPPKVRTMWE